MRRSRGGRGREMGRGGWGLGVGAEIFESVEGVMKLRERGDGNR